MRKEIGILFVVKKNCYENTYASDGNVYAFQCKVFYESSVIRVIYLEIHCSFSPACNVRNLILVMVFFRTKMVIDYLPRFR